MLPRILGNPYLKLVHSQHIGKQKMLDFVKYTVSWPKIEHDIEEFVNDCKPCDTMKNRPRKSIINHDLVLIILLIMCMQTNGNGMDLNF